MDITRDDPREPGAARPFDGLSPQCVIDAVESAAFHCDGRVFALGSYENRVYQVGLEGADPVVAKFYRPGRWPDAAILEEHAFELELAAAEVPVVAPLARAGRTLFEHAGFRFAIFPRRGGRWPELATAEDREWMGRFLGRMHVVGAAGAFRHRPVLSIQTWGIDAARALLDGGFVAAHVEQRFVTAVEGLLEQIDGRFDEVGAVRLLRLHGDCHRGNVLWTDAGPHFVDLDDAMTGPAVQDLWMLLAGSADEMHDQLQDLLRGYTRFAPFESRQAKLIEALRGLRLIHYNAWLARRWNDPAFPMAFPWFAEPTYWERLTADLVEQAGRIEESAWL
jgi:Ser/Thr protein kinase RdoA (MazF antagonist)